MASICWNSGMFTKMKSDDNGFCFISAWIAMDPMVAIRLVFLLFA